MEYAHYVPCFLFFLFWTLKVYLDFLRTLLCPCVQRFLLFFWGQYNVMMSPVFYCSFRDNESIPPYFHQLLLRQKSDVDARKSLSSMTIGICWKGGCQEVVTKSNDGRTDIKGFESNIKLSNVLTWYANLTNPCADRTRGRTQDRIKAFITPTKYIYC